VLLDASARRFQAKKIHLRALAAMRWVNGRHAVLQGQNPHQGHTVALQRTDQALRTVGKFSRLRKGLTNAAYPGAGCGNKRESFQRFTDGGPTSRVLPTRRPFTAKDSHLDKLPLRTRLSLRKLPFIPTGKFGQPYGVFTCFKILLTSRLFLIAFPGATSQSAVNDPSIHR
jgi:hypothetical protein